MCIKNLAVTLLLLSTLYTVSGCADSSSDRNPNSTPAVPSSPAALTVVPSDTQLTVTWTAAAGATSYEVYYGTSNDTAAAALAPDADRTDTTCVISGLANGIPCYVWVKAKNSAGTSAFSSVATETPAAPVLPEAPGAPTVAAGDGELTVTWTQVDGATSYEVYWSTTNDSAGATLFGGDENDEDTTCTVTGLTNGAEYYIWVKAKNGAGSSDFSAVATETPAPPVPLPDTPGAPTVTAGDGELTVTWTAVDGATSYEVYWSTTNDPAGATLFAGDADDQDATCVVAGLTNGTEYYIWVKAKNSAGTSTFSAASAQTPSAGEEWSCPAGSRMVSALLGNNATADGTTDKPYKTITAALAGMTEGTVCVGPGTYDAALGEVFPIVLPDGVALIGDEANKGQGPTPTKIIGGARVLPAPAGECNFCQTALELGADTTVAGFELTNANDAPANPPLTLIIRNSRVTLRNNSVVNNPSRSGVYITDGSTDHIIVGNNISRNTTGAGIVFRFGGVGSRVENNVIKNNAYGIEYDSAGGDLGGGAANSAGANTISCNSTSDLWIRVHDDDAFDVDAANNLWDHVPLTVSESGSYPNDGDRWDLYNYLGRAGVTTTGASVAGSPCP